MHVTIQPARNVWPEKADDGKREKLQGPEVAEKRLVANKREEAQSRENRADGNAQLYIQFSEYSQQMQAEQKDERAGYRCDGAAMFFQKLAHSACRGTKRNEDDRQTADKGQRGSQKLRARGFAFAQLVHANS